MDEAPSGDNQLRRLELMALDDLPDAAVNTKAHDRVAIGRGIDRFGMLSLPLLDERTGRLVAGHGRRDDLRARRDAGQDPPDRAGVVIGEDGVWRMFVVRGWASRDDDEAIAAGMADNQAVIAGGWDLAATAAAIRQLADADAELVEFIGFGDDDFDEFRRVLGETAADETAFLDGFGQKPGTAPGNVLSGTASADDDRVAWTVALSPDERDALVGQLADIQRLAGVELETHADAVLWAVATALEVLGAPEPV